MPASRMILPKRSWSLRITARNVRSVEIGRVSPDLWMRSLHVGQLRNLGDLLGQPRDHVGRRLGGRGDAERRSRDRSPARRSRRWSAPAAATPARFAEATPSTLTLPAATCGITAVGAAQIIGIWPASTSLSDQRRAAIRHVDDVDLGERVQHHQREMMRRADARACRPRACRARPWRARSARWTLFGGE